MESRHKEQDHSVSLRLSVVQAVESSAKALPYYETTRNNRRKRIYESIKPLQHFHLEYKLLPGSNEPIYRTDVVGYDIVSKIFTEQDERVVHTWRENNLTYYGWRHSHHFNTNLQSLLCLYDHVVEIRIWNTPSRQSPKAKYDRPKAFRLPIPIKEKFLGRPEVLPGVYHDIGSSTKIARKRSRRPSEMIESVEAHEELRPPAQPTIVEEAEPNMSDLSASLPPPIKQTETQEERPPSPSPGLKGVSKRRLKQLQAEAAEKARIDKEGIAMLSIKLSDLFAGRKSVTARMATPVANLKEFEVELSLESPLMPEALQRFLNPVTISVANVVNLPPLGIPVEQIKDKCHPVYICYQFYDKPISYTPRLPYAPNITWNSDNVLLLGTIEQELLLEYLRGPPLVLQVHDRDRRHVKQGAEDTVVFGGLWTDPLLGTCGYGKAHADSLSMKNPQNSFGVAKLDLSDLLRGLQVIEFTLPIINLPGYEHLIDDGSGHSPNEIARGDYLKSDSQLTVKVELMYPLEFTPIPVTGGDKLLSMRPLTPFGRAVFIISSHSPDLIGRLLALVNEINSNTLKFDKMPTEVVRAALSTYKLTQEQMQSSDLDIITGFHVEDQDRHIVVLEGLHWKGLHRIWDELPHHSSQDKGVIKIFYNSDYTFSSRLYGGLDVDLTHIKLPHPLHEIMQQPSLYIRGTVPWACYVALRDLNEFQLVKELSDIVHNGMFPTVEMVMTLNLYCTQFGILVNDKKQHRRKAKSLDACIFKKPDTVKRERRRSWDPIDNRNDEFDRALSERKNQPRTDHIVKNITTTRRLSEEVAARRGSCAQHIRSFSENDKPVHLYSSMRFNSTVLGQAKLYQQLDPHSCYTYSQQYHHMTLALPNWEEKLKHYWKREDKNRWMTNEGFVYPPHKTTTESNKHPLKPDTRRIEQLEQPFLDNQLHANTMHPSVDWEKIPWKYRDTDFERYQQPPVDFGVQHPATIHLAGESRKRELEEYEAKLHKSWQSRLVVTDTRFHGLRRGLRTEMTVKGPKAATKADHLTGLLKDPPIKNSFKFLPVNQLPTLTVVRELTDEERGVVGYFPGPCLGRSLKLNWNTVSITKTVPENPLSKTVTS